jgi:hypothetical protein
LAPATGHITWPEALRAQSDAEHRKKIEELIQLRTFTSTTDDIGLQIHTAARQMQAELKDGIRDLPANEDIDARKFLDSLAFEGYSPRSMETAGGDSCSAVRFDCRGMDRTVRCRGRGWPQLSSA